MKLFLYLKIDNKKKLPNYSIFSAYLSYFSLKNYKPKKLQQTLCHKFPYALVGGFGEIYFIHISLTFSILFFKSLLKSHNQTQRQ